MRRVFGLSVALVAYTVVGYPLLTLLAARLRPRPLRRRATPLPTVTLVISAYNEAESIAGKLDNCLETDYPLELLEVIVVSDGSDDGTDHVAARSGVTVLHERERRGKAAALARGAAVASGDVLVFSDANNLYGAGTIGALVAPFADPDVGVVTGRKAIDAGTGRLLDRLEGLYWRYESALKTWESGAGSVAAVVGEALALRREAFRRPPEGTINDDFVIAMTAAETGWRLVYAPDAISTEPASATVADEAVRRTRIVAGRWQALGAVLPGLLRRRPLFALQVVSHKGLRPLVPFAIAAATVSGATRRRGLGRALLLVQAAFLAAAAAGAAVERAGGRRRVVLYAPYYLVKMQLSAVRGLVEARRSGDGALWARVRRGEPVTPDRRG